MKFACTLLLCAVLAPFAHAQAEPKPVTPISILKAPLRETARTFADMARIHDKVFAISGWAYVSAYSADMISTKQAFDRCPLCVEGGSLANGERSVGKLSLEWGAVGIANLVIAHAWKEHAHNRFMHALWSSGLVYEGSNHVRAAYHNAGFSRTSRLRSLKAIRWPIEATQYQPWR